MTDPKQSVALRHLLLLVLSLAMVVAPHGARVPWWLIALAAVLAAWRIHLAHASLRLPSRWLTPLIVIAATFGVYFHYRTIFGRDAGVALLVAMLGLKLIETRTLRDTMLLIFLGYFLVITNFFYSQTILTALYMLASLLVITATMVGLHYAHAEPPFRAQLRIAGVLLAQSVPLMLVLFLLFPRVQGPLWGIPRDAFAGVSGLSETMSPGSLSELSLSDAVAFRVKFKKPIPETKHLYWRGPVMWDFDGRTWSTPRFLYGAPKFTASSEPIEYEVTLEPHNKRWLFALELPGKVPPRVQASADYQLYAFEPVINRMRYEMTSYLETSYGSDDGRYPIRRALALPDGYNPRALEYARTLRARFADDRALVREVLGMFRNENFFYTLTPPLLGEHPVDEFLFSTRRGFCEHYASAFTVLMRAAGIPSRIVTGYQGGEVNQLGDYLIVRQAEAHAWTEIWLKDRGWVRVDPTAAVSPLRVESGISAAVPLTDPLPLLMRGDFEFLRQMLLTWDLMANTWNQWVLGYTPERQRQFLSKVGLDDATWQTLSAILLCVTGLVVAVLAFLTLRQLRTRVHDPVKIAYLRFCNKLRRNGLPRDPAEGPVAYANRLGQSRPDLASAISAITRLYVSLRYGPEPDMLRLRELQRQIKQFNA